MNDGPTLEHLWDVGIPVDVVRPLAAVSALAAGLLGHQMLHVIPHIKSN